MGSSIAELPPSTSQPKTDSLTLSIMKVLVFLAIASCVVLLANAKTEFQAEEEVPSEYSDKEKRCAVSFGCNPPRGKRSLVQAEEKPCFITNCPRGGKKSLEK